MAPVVLACRRRCAPVVAHCRYHLCRRLAHGLTQLSSLADVQRDCMMAECQVPELHFAVETKKKGFDNQKSFIKDFVALQCTWFDALLLRCG